MLARSDTVRQQQPTQAGHRYSAAAKTATYDELRAGECGLAIDIAAAARSSVTTQGCDGSEAGAEIARS